MEWILILRNEGSSSANKRYKYAITPDALNRLSAADFSYYTTSWQPTSTYDVTGVTYDQNGSLTALQRYKDTGTTPIEIPAFAGTGLTYVYDTGKNRLDHVDACPERSEGTAVTTTTETWDTEDAATDAFTYDANGNMLKAQAPYSITSMTYEPRNLPMTMVKGGVTTNYRYSLGGQRYWKAVGSGTPEYYAMDGSVPTALTTNTGTITHWNVIANGQVVGRYEGTTKKYYWRDHLGSIRVVVNSSGTVLQADDFYPFGLKMPGRSFVSGAPSKESFTGKERDSETGLDYFGARYYMPALGRWGVVDPLAGEYPGWSAYNFVLNSPFMLVDPNGMSAECPDPPCNPVHQAIAEGRSLFEKAVSIFRTSSWFGSPSAGSEQSSSTQDISERDRGSSANSQEEGAQAEWQNPTGLPMRGSDPQGEGRYGASRDGGTRTHTGIDIEATPGQGVVSLFDGTADSSASGYVRLSSEDGIYIALYVYTNSTVSGPVQRGDTIGTANNMAIDYGPGMTNHVHMQVDSNGIRINPARRIFP